MTSLVWLRDDLRLADNPALSAAIAAREPLAIVYLLDDDSTRPTGAAARWWLHRSLQSLAADLARRGQRLILRRGRAARAIPELARESGANRVFWNRRYGGARAVDDTVEKTLVGRGVPVATFNAGLLFEPDEIVTRTGTPFRVYSAFWRAAQARGEPRRPLPRPRKLPPPVEGLAGEALEALQLLPSAPDWSGGIRATWQPGEQGAAERLKAFAGHVAGYDAARDRPDLHGTSMLSPHIRFGEVSPFQVWHAAGDAVTRPSPAAAKFQAELGWREFAWHVLAQVPDMATRNIRPAFDDFPWEEPYEDDMWDWRRGRTGYPIVDAGMRQLWETGWMHNRVRMIAASFLTKHLLIDWRLGEEWFWDTLVDADPASNPFNWQWVAGSGADAQPFFRIFNPVTQGEKLDPDGSYVRRYVPELARLPAAVIHRPWEAGPLELAAAGVALGKTYPLPIVEQAFARARALAAFARIGGKGGTSLP
jgi:deoxyribodipyrimidine photo-lyase